MKYLLDTDTASYLIRGEKTLVAESMAKLGSWCISTITAGESAGWLFGNYTPLLEDRNVQFLDGTEMIKFESQDAIALGRLQSKLRSAKTSIQNMDALIAAHAISRGLTLVTNNTKDFKKIEDLKIENWLS
jgi:tRNA(fMet)-specific endonuclease VapC